MNLEKIIVAKVKENSEIFSKFIRNTSLVREEIFRLRESRERLLKK